ncbi:hypothetical protein LI328DRAFT_170654 [Trichoderma asperelloides]|nr:hypothetical protein LI328DRAFT_170654 [Trichoderma asperelloides]
MRAEEGTHRQDPGSFKDKQQTTIQMVETVLLMVVITTRSEPGPTAHAMSMRRTLDCLIRDEEVLRVRQGSCDSWDSWILNENIKRILFVAFCFLNMHTIVFDLPPVMWANEINVDIPSSEKEWRAKSEGEWKNMRKTVPKTGPSFREGFRCLFSSLTETRERLKINQSSASSLGGCALIHALIQQIWLIRSVQVPLQRLEDSLSEDQMSAFENALRVWAICWEQNQESSMDPSSPYGPIAPSVQRSERLTQAALYCAYALSIPVKLGLSYIAETQVRLWSNQHALCSLECALLLSKWLHSATAETRLLDFVVQLVADTEYRVRYENIRERKVFLGVQTVRLWARLYQSKSVWEVVSLIGASLNIYADLLEQDHLLL